VTPTNFGLDCQGRERKTVTMRGLVAECRGCGQCNVPVRAPPCWRLLLTVMGGVRWVRLLGATTDPSSASQRGLGGRLEHGWEAVR
jgi:hypothetical protein